MAQRAIAGIAALVLSGATGAMAQTVTSGWFATINSGDVNAAAKMLDSGQVSVGSLLDTQLNTALHLAAERCNVGMIQLLRTRGASANAPNKWNDTPLTIATVRCGAGSPAVVALSGGVQPPSAPAAPAASPDGKTPASAAQFIIQMTTDGTWDGTVSECYNGDCTQTTGIIPVAAAYTVGGDPCVIKFRLTGKSKSIYRTVDLRKNILTSSSYGPVTNLSYLHYVYFSGPISTTDGAIDSEWYLIGPSSDSVDRVAGAFQYLTEQCRAKSLW